MKTKTILTICALLFISLTAFATTYRYTFVTTCGYSHTTESQYNYSDEDLAMAMTIINQSYCNETPAEIQILR